MSEGNKKPIEEALANLKTAHQNQDLATIETAMEALNKAWEGASQEMYQATQAEGAATNGAQPDADAGTDGGTNGDDVSDVEYEEVK